MFWGKNIEIFKFDSGAVSHSAWNSYQLMMQYYHHNVCYRFLNFNSLVFWVRTFCYPTVGSLVLYRKLIEERVEH